MLNEDYKEMLQLLLSKRVRFLVVGAYALGVYGYPRATGDLDIWVEASPANSKKVYLALRAFKAPVLEITARTFAEEGVVFQVGLAPRRIDIITKIDGVDFKDAYAQRQDIKIDKFNVPFLSKRDLIKNKESTGRAKDKLDAQALKKDR